MEIKKTQVDISADSQIVIAADSRENIETDNHVTVNN